MDKEILERYLGYEYITFVPTLVSTLTFEAFTYRDLDRMFNMKKYIQDNYEDIVEDTRKHLKISKKEARHILSDIYFSLNFRECCCVTLVEETYQKFLLYLRKRCLSWD